MLSEPVELCGALMQPIDKLTRSCKIFPSNYNGCHSLSAAPRNMNATWKGDILNWWPYLLNVRWIDYREGSPMTRIVLTALVLLDCVAFGTELFAQAGQTVNPVPITPPTLNTAPTTCQTSCDVQAMTCLNSCVPTAAATAASPGAAASSGACNLNCTTQQLVCKQRC
jgi:hypothetical protein